MYRRTPSFLAACAGPRRFLVAASVAVGCFVVMTPDASAALLSRTSSTPAASGTSSSSAAQTSQTATAATQQTAQAAAASTRTAASLQRLNTAMMALQNQMAAQTAANLNALNNLDIDQKTGTSPASLVNVANGIGVGGLVPSGGAIVNPAGSGIQSIQLQGSGSGISLANGGNVSLVKGTGNGLVTASGAGSITATGGTITATQGSLSTTTTSGGTLTTANGGTVTTSAANETIASSSSTTVTISGSGGIITALDGTTTTFTAPTTSVSFALPAGSTITLSSAATVTATGATVLSLSGAGSLATTSGGAVTNTGGTTTFSGAVSATLPGGAAIDFAGSGSLNLASGSSGFSVNVPTSAAVTAIGSASISNTTGYVLPASWVNVGSLSDSQPVNPASGGLTDVVNVVQTGQQALLTWDSFNVGARTELDFDQSAGGANVGNWVAINKITSNINPSWILGSIQAPGQVYVINPNGIIFTGTSQVNTHTLVASSLPINDNLVNTGLLNNSADLSYLFSSLQSSTTGAGLFTPPLSTSGSPASPTEIGGTAPDGGTVVNVSTGGVIVEAGAQIQSPTTPEHVGGRVALIGPSVENDGIISTPDGQTILAAGFQVGFLAHNSNDPTLRGLDVYLGAATDTTGSYNSGSLIQAGLFPTAGIAANGLALNDPNAASLGVPALTADYGQSGSPMFGLIDTPRADLYLAGADIQQNGIVNSSTSVALNGRIDINAAYDEITFQTLDTTTDTNITSGLPTTTGNVTFGAGSVTEILPEQTTDTVVGTQLALNSIINVQALSVDLQPGANVLAPSANVSIVTGSYGRDPEGLTPVFASDQGTVELEQGSAIDVSGSADVSASVAENIVAVQLRGTELANSPVQQDGALRGQTVYVDMSQYGTYNGTNWIGSPIGDLSGYAALIQHTASELTVNGGTIALTAGTSVSVNSGATLDVSGGSIDYAGASVNTTKVVSNGQIFDISQATPNRVYSGILTNFSVDTSKWGISQSYANSELTPQYDPGYVQGGNGGSLSVTAPTITLNGIVSGNTTAGVRQQLPQSTLPTVFGGSSTVSTSIQSIYGVPKASTLQLDFSNQVNQGGVVIRQPDTGLNINFQPGTVTNSNPSTTEFDLSTDLMNADGFGNLKLVDDFGTITLPANTPLDISPGGSLTLSSLNIDIMSDISVAGGTLNFSATQTLNLNASLDVSGLIVDASSASSVGGNLPQFINGGTVTLQSSNLLINDPTGVLNVSGGLYVSPANKQTFGAAGTLTLDSAVDLIDAQNSVTPEVSQFSLGGIQLEGYSGLRTGAGKLNIQAPLIQIGGTSLVNGGSAQNTLLVPAQFFNGGMDGFGTVLFTGVGNSSDLQQASVLVAPGTVIKPEVQSWVSVLNNGQYALAPTLQSLTSLRSPVSISLNAPGVADPSTGQRPGVLDVRGNVVIGQGAVLSLDADPGNSVQLFGGTFGTVAVLGQIYVPGGTISIEADGNTAGIFNSGAPTDMPLITVDLGPNSILSTSGATELTSNVLGLKTGTVLNGGTVSVTGNILAEQGSQILVDGASDMLAVASGFSSPAGNLAKTASSSYVTVPVDSNGGSIILKGKEELFTEATLSGAAGGPSAQGGSLTVSSGSFFSPTDIVNLGGKLTYPNDASLVLTNSALTYDASSLSSTPATGAIGVDVPATSGSLVTDAHGKTIYGYFSAQEFAGSGLNSLNLSGNLEIATAGGNINLSAASSISFASQGVILLNDPTKNVTVSLSAPYITMGQYYSPATQQSQEQTTFDNNGNPIAPHIFNDPVSGAISGLAPLPGNGTLDINASTLVDVYTLSLQGFGTLNINQGGLPAGDVRGAGTLELQGNINIEAGQIYPATEANFTIAAYSGSINVTGTGQLPALPYSAGGTLDLYAATINQDGVLRAPMGVINVGAAPNTLDILSQTNFDTATTVVLGSQSVTSVSLIDPTTGQALIVPYGTDQNGTNWIDPAGNDITLAPNGALGIPTKQIFVVGNSVTDAAGAVIDIQGGGDLYSARWVTGTGGTKDILNTNNTGSFAVIPSYGAGYAPLDPTPGYSTTTSLAATTLKVGDRVYLSGGGGLPAGYYTLLPAEYALLPGGFLVTPQSTAPVLAGSQPSVAQTDGSALVTGYKFSGLAVGGGSAATAPSLYSTFEVASGSVVHARAEYDNFTANTFLQQSAVAGNQSVPRLPVDAGQLVFNAGTQLLLNGSDTIETAAGTLTLSTPAGEAGLVEPVTIDAPTTGVDENLTSVGTGALETASTTGLGGLVDISSTSTIDILDSGTAANALVLLTSQLNGLNASSLLIGGTRGTDGETVTVATDDLEVNDHGQALTGNDLILVSSGQLNVDTGSIISTPASDSSITPPPLIVNGNGALIRVSSGQNEKVTRTNINTSNQNVSLNIAGAQFSAVGSTTANPLSVGTLLLDSTGQFQLDSGASLASVLNGDTLTLNAGQISILFPNSGASTPTNGLVLTQAQIQALQQSVKNLNFTSYSSIDMYGAGSLGTNASRQTVLQNLALEASQIRGYYLPSSVANTGISLSALGSVSFQDAAFNLTPAGANPITSQFEQSLNVNAPTINLGGGTGNNSFAIYGFQNTNLTAGKDILVMSTAATNQSTSTSAPQALFDVVNGALNLSSPLITSQTGSNLEILAGVEPTGGPNVYQNITITSNGTLDPTLEQGLDSTLLIKGANITDSSAIVMPSGQVILEATSGNLTMNGSVDVSGAATTFDNNITEYTNGGTVTLKADNGNLDLTGGSLNVSAKSGVGTTAANAGSVALHASGSLLVDQTTVMHGQGGSVTSTANGPVVAQGQNGSFSLDAAATNPMAKPGGSGTASDLGLLASILSPANGNFTQSQNIRIRSGDVQVGASTVITANSFTLSADTGNVDVYGTINAAGVTGGQVALDASGNVNLHDGSLVSVAGQRFADSGKGGSVSLEGGSYNGSTNTSANVTIASNATVDLSVGSGSVVQLAQPGNSVSLSTPGTVILQSGLSTASSVTVNGSGYVLSPSGTRTTFTTGTTLTNLASGSMIIFTTANGSMTLAAGSAPVLLPAGVAFTTNSSALQLTASGTSSVAFQPGVIVTLPQGTPGNDQVILYGSGTVTEPGGITIAFVTIHDPGQPDDGTVTFTTTAPGGTPSVSNYLSATSLPAGSQIQFDPSASNTNARIAFANGGTGGAVPFALATTDTLIAPVTLGNATGTLQITVPATNFNTTGIVAQGNILSPSSIMLQGTQIYGANTPAASVAIDGFESQITSDATTNVTAWDSLIPTILGNNSSLAGLTTAGYGAEIVNSGGDLVLNNTWDLSSLSSAGILGTLTLRASGNIILKGGTFSTNSSTLGASLTDGFSSSPTTPWTATLLTTPSWSFNLTAGADLSSANISQVTAGQGSLQVGLGGPSMTVDQASLLSNQQATTASTQNLLTAYYQTIRTGTGNINISTGADVQLLNALANIYTAGQQLSPSQTTSVLSSNDFDLPQLTIPGNTSANKSTLGNRPNPNPYIAQYSWGGGDVTISAGGNIEHLSQNGSPDSSLEMPTSWLDRRGYTSNGLFADNRLTSSGGTIRGVAPGGIASTSWWVDFSNFFDGIGALGGGNVTLTAGGNVTNVDASIPTNARMVGADSTGAGVAPNAGNLVELGGGDLVVQAGTNIDGGVYYVERGTGTLDAGYKILTNSTRATTPAKTQVAFTPDPQSWLPTTLFVGAASFNVTAGSDLELGSTLNPFLLPQNIDNSYLLKTYFSTYASSDVVNVQSLLGNVTIEGANSTNTGTVGAWYNNVLGFLSLGSQSWSYFQPWLGLAESNPSIFTTAASLLPPTLQVTAFSNNSQGTSGNISLNGDLTFSPSPTGNLDLVAANSISGLSFDSVVRTSQYTTINLSDANPANIAGITSPLSYPISLAEPASSSAFISSWETTPTLGTTGVDLFASLSVLFNETSSTTGLLQTKEELHASIADSTGVLEPLHFGDPNPVHLDAGTGDISGLTLFSPKFTDIIAGQDLTDIGLYIQNTSSSDVSVVSAGRDLIAYDAGTPIRLGLISTYNLPSGSLPNPQTGDIQISGPGAIEVLAGQNFDLGISTGTSSTGLGLTSIGNGRNPVLPFAGADIIAAAGLGNPAGLDSPNLDFPAFIQDYLTPGTLLGSTYLSDLGALLGLTNASDTTISAAFDLLPQSQQNTYALAIFYDVLRDAGRNGPFSAGYSAISTLFPDNGAATWPYHGDITLTSREIKTTNGGNISLLTTGGQVTVGLPVNGSQTLEQGVFTVAGGNISIFADSNVNVGVSRIFTLDGGAIIIWSSNGNIAAGASSKTVQSAPPTRVIIDPTSGNVQTDLGGLATGGGIGTKTAFVGAPPSPVDLIAPAGTIDAGDAGISASGDVHVAALHIANASNITSGGSTTGVPTTAAPNVAGLSAASSAAGSATQAGLNNTPTHNLADLAPAQLPSIITVEVLGYGGGDTD
jgi:filamentous hemagglutinin